MELISKISDDFFSMEYTVVDGQWSLPNSFIQQFYTNLRRRDLIFYNIKDLDKFNPLAYFRSVRLFVGFNKEGKCFGGFWVSSPNSLNHNGWFNCGMVKDAFEEPTDYIKVAHLGLKHLLERDDFKVLFGETSITNKAIIGFSEYFGFQKLGIIPNAHYHAKDEEFCDSVFMWIDKDHLREEL